MKGFNIHISGNQINTNLFFENDYDSFVFKNDEVEIAIEGIILNKQQLLQNSSYSNFSDFNSVSLTLFATSGNISL